MTIDAHAAAHHAIPVRTLQNAALWLAVALSAFVFVEPSPHEVYMLALAGVWFVAGLAIPQRTAPLLILLVLFVAGGFLALPLTRPEWRMDGQLYVLISGFMGLTAVFYASVVAGDGRRLAVIENALVWTATIVSALGILAYFRMLPGSEQFLLYDRARATFKDPNVFAPFLLLPTLILVRRIMDAGAGEAARLAVPLAIILLGIFLSFSRAAWGATALALLVIGIVAFATTASARLRARYVVIGIVGAAFLMALIAVALSIDSVASLFDERAQLVQYYEQDSPTELGRFGRHWAGFAMVPDNPLGLGPFEFALLFGEATHNLYLKGLMEYGWLGGFSLIALLLWTAVAGFPLLKSQRPWRRLAQSTYVAYLAHLGIAWVIDVDHWRHFFLLLGLLWGMMALEAAARRAAQATARSAPTSPGLPAPR